MPHKESTKPALDLTAMQEELMLLTRRSIAHRKYAKETEARIRKLARQISAEILHQAPPED